MFGSRDRRSWCLLSPHELGLDPKLNLEPLNYLSHSFVYLVFCTASVYSYYHAHVHMMGSIKVFANSPIMHLQFLQPPTPAKTLLAALRRTPGS